MNVMLHKAGFRNQNPMKWLLAYNARQLVPPMRCPDVSCGAATGAHDHRLGDGSVLGIADASEQVAAGDPGAREETVVALDKVVEREDCVHVHAQGLGVAPLVVVAEIK